MKNALVILIGLAVAGTAGEEVYRAIALFGPTAISAISAPDLQREFESSAFSAATMRLARAPRRVQEGTAPTPLRVQGTATGGAPEYTDYASGVIGNGQRVLLYFRSSSDGSSVQSDRELISLYSAGRASIATYRVDYDIAFSLGRAYGVSAPNTFVLLDGDGDIEKSITDPSPELLEALVQYTGS